MLKEKKGDHPGTSGKVGKLPKDLSVSWIYVYV